MDDFTEIILPLILGIFLGILIYMIINLIRRNNTQKKANDIIENAKKEAEKHKRDSLYELKEESFKLKEQTDIEVKEKRVEVHAQEERLLQRESSLDKRDDILQKKDLLVQEKEINLLAKQKNIQEKEDKMEELLKDEVAKLESISGLTVVDAKTELMDLVRKKSLKEINEYIKREESNAKLKAKEKAKAIILNSMEKYSDSVVIEQSVSTINLPSDDMKGRLIGREGRNIRTIESITGVDLIIDDTPEVIVISSFDPLRREIAKICIETLISDGKIHPSRVEDIYNKTLDDVNDRIMEIGNETIDTLGISNVDTELVRLIGKLKFRTSYGQNALKHSIEVANLTGLMASELGENVVLAKRAGLLHDIGKSIDYEVEGSHVEIGFDVAKKYGEDKVVLNAIMSHHGDVEATSIISELVAVADTLSAARPGARSDSIENYIKRLEQLESIGNSFDGVEKTFALQAGRELRVMVKPGEVSDDASFEIARSIKERVEKEMQYPGTIKITVIRESRVLEEAK